VLAVLPHEKPDKPSIGGGHGQVPQILLVHSSDHRFKSGAWPDRAWSGRHRVLDALLLLTAERAAAQATEDDTRLVDHEAGIPARPLDSLADVSQGFVEAAYGDVGANVRPRSGLRSGPAVKR
jgi:hypothetical protein